MIAIHGYKTVGVFVNAHVECKLYKTAATIAAHAAWVAIGIIIDHFKIIAGLVIEHHKAIGPDTKAAVADLCNPLVSKLIVAVVPVIEDDKVVAGTMVFIEL